MKRSKLLAFGRRSRPTFGSLVALQFIGIESGPNRCNVFALSQGWRDVALRDAQIASAQARAPRQRPKPPPARSGHRAKSNRVIERQRVPRPEPEPPRPISLATLNWPLNPNAGT
jgi:hypothetical protein